VPQRSDGKFAIMGGAIFIVSKSGGCLVLVYPVEGAFWCARAKILICFPPEQKKSEQKEWAGPPTSMAVV
jgi:hypothetical protein